MRSRLARKLAILVVTASLLTACTEAPTTRDPSGTAGSPGPPPSVSAPIGSAAAGPRLGGTLRVGGGPDHDPFEDPEGKRALDPQFDFGSWSWELYRCCLLRTLLSYSGRSAAEGGSRLQPDLAVAMPEVSADGLTWTFRMKRGVRYAPPLEETEIVAGDVIRALERTLTPAPGEAGQAGLFHGGYSSYYEPVIEGARAFTTAQADRISGLEAPDSHTLVVRLTEPNGVLGHLFSLPAAAPLPPHPTDPSAPHGVATGLYEGYGYRLVSSGPYMLEGAERLDPTLAPEQQSAASGWVPRTSLALVRNPSWDRATDALRGAYVDRIEITVDFEIGGPAEQLEAMWDAIDAGTKDVLLIVDTPADRIAAALADPARSDRVHVVDADIVTFLPLNLAQPPFDDIHIRRAVNFAIDRESLLALRTPIIPIGPFAGRVHNHLAPDSLLDNLLLRYQPFPSEGGRGDLEAAKRQVAASEYDGDRDGICDATACRDVLTLVNPRPGTQAVAAAVAEDLAAIGITLRLEDLGADVTSNDFFERLYDPRTHAAMAIDIAYFKDYPNAESFFASQFLRGPDPDYWNPMAVGARPEELEAYGYEPLEIPNLDARIRACHALVGQAQVECWAEFDQYVTETLVVAVPFGSFQSTRLVSDRIETFHFDQFTAVPALDQISLKPG